MTASSRQNYKPLLIVGVGRGGREFARSVEDHGATAGKDFGYRRAKHTMPSSEEDH